MTTMLQAPAKGIRHGQEEADAGPGDPAKGDADALPQGQQAGDPGDARSHDAHDPQCLAQHLYGEASQGCDLSCLHSLPKLINAPGNS